MTRRLFLTMLLVVAATLTLAGLGTLLLALGASRETTEDELRAQAEATTALLQASSQAIDSTLTAEQIPPRERPTVITRLQQLRKALDVENLDVIIIRKDGELNTDLGEALRPGFTIETLDPGALRAGETVSGSVRGTVYAAKAWGPLDADGTIRSDGPIAIVLLTRQPRNALGDAPRWFLAAAATSLLVAGLASLQLSKRLTRPLREATDTTSHIADGDLAARVVVPAASRKRDELADLGRSINRMAETLERSRGLEQQFLLSISHDLRTPLTSIRGYAEAIADDAAPDAHGAAAVILSEARRLERLVRDLLDLARLDAKQFSLHPARLDLGVLAAEVAEAFGPEAAQAGVALTVDTPSAQVLAMADPDRVAQVVGNLVQNALGYATSGVRIVVLADVAPVIEVIDDGPGIPPEDQPHVFERLYQASARPVRRESGAGVGLAIVSELVTAMGGTVEIASAVGLGTRMIVRLPAPA